MLHPAQGAILLLSLKGLSDLQLSLSSHPLTSQTVPRMRRKVGQAAQRAGLAAQELFLCMLPSRGQWQLAPLLREVGFPCMLLNMEPWQSVPVQLQEEGQRVRVQLPEDLEEPSQSAVRRCSDRPHQLYICFRPKAWISEGRQLGTWA